MIKSILDRHYQNKDKLRDQYNEHDQRMKELGNERIKSILDYFADRKKLKYAHREKLKQIAAARKLEEGPIPRRQIWYVYFVLSFFVMFVMGVPIAYHVEQNLREDFSGYFMILSGIYIVISMVLICYEILQMGRRKK